jgi:hypothetical protein
MKTIKIKIKGCTVKGKEKIPLTFVNKIDCKKQLKSLLSQMPEESKQEAKDNPKRFSFFCYQVWNINENIMCDSLESSMFPVITFLPSVKKPVLKLPGYFAVSSNDKSIRKHLKKIH